MVRNSRSLEETPCDTGSQTGFRFVVTDLFGAIAPRPLFDLIVSNPPYVSDAELLDLAPEIANYEPRSALRGGGKRGLALIRKILEQFHARLKPKGSLLMEIGLGQAEILEAEFSDRIWPEDSISSKTTQA